MALAQTNATISVLRGAYNPATKQTSAPSAVATLANIDVFVDEIGTDLRARGMAPEYSLMLLWDPRYDIRDGDQITGYNPAGAAVPPILIVQHAASEGVGTPLACRVALLVAKKPAGSST